jgi:branched-chain amino acid transport system permease protein
VPVTAGGYVLDVFTFMLINLILVVSYRLIVNMGLWSFAHIPLMGIGGYTAGLLVIRAGWNFWGAFPVAVLVSLAAALVISIPVLRTRGFYFFLSTFAAGQAIYWSWIVFERFFGSHRGIGVIPSPDPVGGINFRSPIPYYYLVLGFTLLSLFILYRLEKSRIGATVSSIRASEELSEAMGINSGRYRTIVFCAAGAFAGLAGVLFSFYTGTASPADYSFVYAINILVFVIVGGTGSFFGPIVGVAVLTAITEALRGFNEFLPLIYGVILIAIVLLQPGGLVAIPPRISRLVERRRQKMIVRRTTE